MSATAPSVATQKKVPASFNDVWIAGAYALMVAAATLWLAGISSPLWLDETYSWWQISAGFGKIWSRSIPTPSYGFSYALWLWQSLFHSKEWVLRIPSLFAMAAATHILYRCARELFPRDVAAAVALVFAVHPIVQNEASDFRPYAMGVMVLTVALWSLLRWARTNETRYAVMLGLSAAGVFYFQLLLAAIVPALLLAVLALRRDGFQWKQLGWAVLAFLAGVLPVIPGFLYVAHTAHSHSFDSAPSFSDLLDTFAPLNVLVPFLFLVLLAAAFRRISQSQQATANLGAALLIVGFFPLALLFFVSSVTDLRIFVPRHRIVAIPGLALCWGLMLSYISSRALRAAFCVVVLLAAALPVIQSPGRDWHFYSWRDALRVADTAAARDHAPLLICSDLPESDYLPIPENPLDSPVFAQISYYKVSAPVVGLPRTLTPAASAHIDKFLESATPKHQRFLALSFINSQPVIDELIQKARADYRIVMLGTFDRVQVLEFQPRLPEP